MDAEIVEKDKITTEKPSQAVYLGEYAIKGGPGRPMGSKNKFTMVKEALVDAFFSAEGQEAFQNTLVYDDRIAGADGKPRKIMNLEALRAVLRVLPREDQSIGNTYNFNVIVGELRKLPADQLRSFLAGRRQSNGNGGGESPGV